MKRNKECFCWIFSPSRGKSIDNFKQIVESDDQMIMNIQSIDEIEDNDLNKQFELI